MLREYHVPPWDWDMDYPDDMRENKEYFPEDINGLVGIDSEIALEIQRRREENSKKHAT